MFQWLQNLKLKRDRKLLDHLADRVLDGKNEPFRHYCNNRKARPCGCMVVTEVNGLVREQFVSAYPNRAQRRRLKRRAAGRVVSK